ncbi:MAG: hypothetical protein GY833_10830 [Aestuariibacter sp.]|nr:hypothetical protein [Aestuariibacter sp.]|tara:strand:+ start:158018 stop:158275 length:258 start_codon:yes stop_codon:yes gene_type:complete
MAATIFAAVDEGYDVTRIDGYKGIVDYAKGYTTANGSEVTLSVAKQEIKDKGCIRLYNYDADDLEEAKQEGSVRGADWTYRIIKL